MHFQVAPAYTGLELGVGESLLVKAIASATGRTIQHIKSEVVSKGDLGIVAEVRGGENAAVSYSHEINSFSPLPSLLSPPPILGKPH